MRPVWIVFALLSLPLVMQGCVTDSPREAEIDTASEKDTLQPEQQIDPTDQVSGKVSCVGIAPPANIQKLQHDQCADWSITECTSTLERCGRDDQASTCCCILCGMRSGEPTCFNVRCP
jgi:hypothetical protein